MLRRKPRLPRREKRIYRNLNRKCHILGGRGGGGGGRERERETPPELEGLGDDSVDIVPAPLI